MSDLKLTGKIIEILPKETGTSKAGKEWEKQTFVIDIGTTYNNQISFGLFGSEKVENFNKYNKVGSDVDVSFNISCREHNSKWYTQLDAWKVFKTEVDTEAVAVDEADDLPF